MSDATPSAEAFAAEAGTTPVVVDNGGNNPQAIPTKTENSKFYTEDDLVKVRSQEKDKLYPVIDQLKEELSLLKKSKEEEAAHKAEIAAQEEAERSAREKAKIEEELSAKDLIKAKEQEWQQMLEQERQERETAIALLERERAYADLTNYRAQRLEQERENIIPELVDLISGNTREELDASLEGLKERSSRILESAQQAMQTARKEMTGTRATFPPAGPMETNSDSRQFTAADIANMSMADYAKNRDRIMSNTARGETKGLLG